MGAPRFGLFLKFFTVMVSLAVLAAAILWAQLFVIGRRAILRTELDYDARLATALASHVDRVFGDNSRQVAFLISLLRKQASPAEHQQDLLNFIRTRPDMEEVAVMDRQGRELARAGGRAAIAPAESRAALQALWSGRRVGGVSRYCPIPRLFVSYYPIDADSAVRIAISLRGLSALFAMEAPGRSGLAVLVDSQGAPLAYPPERLRGRVLAEFAAWPVVLAAVRSARAVAGEFPGPEGDAYAGAYAPVSSIGGAVLVLRSRAEAYEPVSRSSRAAGAAMALVVCLSLAAATLLARLLTSPLYALTRAADEVSRGNFLASVDIATGDELQDLSETFNRMTAQLRSYSVLQVDGLVAEQRITEAVLYSSSDAIIMCDKEGKIRLANRRAIEVFGLNPRVPVEGKTIFEAIPGSRLRDAIVGALADPRPSSFKEVDLSTQEILRYLRVTAQPVATPRGLTLGVVVAVRDVTLDRRLDKMKEEFLQYITHDLRNPLGSAIGFLDFLLKGSAGVLNPEQRAIANSIRRATTRLMGMINNILDIAKMEAGRMRVELKDVSIAGIAGRSIAILESLARQKEIRVSLNANEEFTIKADPDLIERIFLNLLGNAIKFTPRGGSIAVSLSDRDQTLEAVVEDSGEGIPPEFRERIFAKFEQVTGQKRGGTGLGLTIAKFFVEAHLGRIWAESELGRGSRFCFTIPKNLRLDPDGNVSLDERA